MSLTHNMANLELKNAALEQTPDQLNGNWETWKRLKLSVYHGKKLAKRSFKPYHPKTKSFFLKSVTLKVFVNYHGTIILLSLVTTTNNYEGWF